MNVSYLDVHAGQVELQDEIRAAFERVMASGQYVLGEEVESFERDFAAFCGTNHAIGVGNGLDALTITLRASGIGPGDEVIVPAHTFIATWLAVAQCGARIVPVDVDPDRLLLDVDAAAAACTSHTAAIIAVHLYGRPVDPLPLAELGRRRGLLVLGDAAQAHGARAAGRSVGAHGHAAIFSFYPSKNLGAFGDGGAITTDDDSLARSARQIRNYGSESKYDFAQIGVNSRLDPLQAAFLRAKLAVLDEWNRRRRLVAERYLDALGDTADLVLPPPAAPDTDHVWHTFPVQHPQRDALSASLEAQGIQTQVHYPVPPHLTRAFASLGLSSGSFPVTERAADTLLSLPIGPHLSDESVDTVIGAVRSF